MVQWQRLPTRNAGVQGSILGEGARIHMLQIRVPITKTLHNQINKQEITKKKRKKSYLTSLCVNLLISTDWFQIEKEVCQGCILSPCLFNLYAEYIMRNAGLDEAQARIKFSGRNINNLRYADDTSLMAESK